MARRKVSQFACRRWWTPIVMGLALMQLIADSHASIPTTYVNLSSAIDTKTGWVLSPGFPVVQESVYIYSVVFVNTYVSGSIQIVSSDFDLPAGSWLKVYDGEDPSTSPVYVYPRGSRPVFQSRGNTLVLVHKPGPQAWTSQLGWRLSYSFVNYRRESWLLHDIPRTGPCPVLLAPEGRVRLNGVQQDGQVRPIDCSWILRPQDPIGDMYVGIKEISIGSGSDVSVEFRQDHSQGALMRTLPVASGAILSHDAIFVRVNGTLASSVVEFVFSEDGTRLSQSASTFENFTGSSCSYKENTQTGACVNYWDALYYGDTSCDVFIPLYADNPDFSPRCPDTDRCHGLSEVCDGVRDCLYSDEKECEESSESRALAWTQWFGGVCILLFFVCGGHVRYGRNSRVTCQKWNEAARIAAQCLTYPCRQGKRLLQKFECRRCCCSGSAGAPASDTNDNTEEETVEPEIPVIMIYQINSSTSLSGMDNPAALPPPYDHVAIEPPPYPEGEGTSHAPPPPPPGSGEETLASGGQPPPYDPSWNSSLPEQTLTLQPPSYEEALNNSPDTGSG